MYAKLAVDALEMALDGVDRYGESPGDLAVGLPCCDRGQDLKLAHAEGLDGCAEGCGIVPDRRPSRPWSDYRQLHRPEELCSVGDLESLPCGVAQEDGERIAHVDESPHVPFWSGAGERIGEESERR